jgi:hypothetical protein
MDRAELNRIIEMHKAWLDGDDGGERAVLSGADLRWTHLSRAVLSGANLSRAVLSGAALDFSCWPLWCGSIGTTVDARIFRQLLGHLLVVNVEGDGAAECQRVQQIATLRECAAKGHRAKELGIER